MGFNFRLSHYYFSFLIIFSSLQLLANPNQPETVSVHVNCNSCDLAFIRTEIEYVNHVRDQALADVQIFINRINSGSGGQIFEFSFTGANHFDKISQQFRYETPPTFTRDERRKGITKRIEIGLLPYLMDTQIADDVQVKVKTGQKGKKLQEEEVEDKWNNWIFELNVGGNYRKESSRERINMEFGMEGDRVTEDWRIRTAAKVNYTSNRISDDEDTFISVRKFNFARASVARSLGDHWSAGLFTSTTHSSYRNLDFSMNLSPAVEFSWFPYKEVLRREITLAYNVGYVFNDYLETTVYNRDNEALARQSLLLRIRYNQPWGTVFSSLEGSNFLNDFSKNRFEFDSFVSVRLFKGLAIRVSADMELIRDQITLPGKDASLEDLLLQQRQIATDFELGFGFGLSYTFGSAYNNIVNTRL